MIYGMKLEFSYDLERDVENFIKSFSSTNNSEKTVFQNLYLKEYGHDVTPNQVRVFILDYIHSQGINTNSILKSIALTWQHIETRFIRKIEDVFDYNSDAIIRVYLTTNNRCTYNFDKGYFFVYMYAPHPNSIIMHELFHFYTGYISKARQLLSSPSRENYNDLKESLTELLNVEFSEFMMGTVDKGYPQHQALREQVRSLWFSHKNIISVINHLDFHKQKENLSVL